MIKRLHFKSFWGISGKYIFFTMLNLWNTAVKKKLKALFIYKKINKGVHPSGCVIIKD